MDNFIPPVLKAERDHYKALRAYSDWILPDNFTPYSAKAGKPLRLQLRTYKTSHNLLQTVLSAYTRDGASEVTRLYHDYHAVLQADRVRVTEKALLAQHNKHLAMVQESWEEQLQHIAAHYEKLKKA